MDGWVGGWMDDNVLVGSRLRISLFDFFFSLSISLFYFFALSFPSTTTTTTYLKYKKEFQLTPTLTKNLLLATSCSLTSFMI